MSQCSMASKWCDDDERIEHRIIERGSARRYGFPLG